MSTHSLRYAAAFLLLTIAGVYAAQEPRLAPIQYTSDGNIPVPDYSKWVFIGAGAFDSSQTAPAPRFSNVFVSPAAYDAYIRSGSWADGTVIFSEKRAGITTVPITSNPGWGQTGEPLGFEFEVKDAAKGGWRFYTGAAGERVGKPVEKQSDCTTCHTQKGAVDSTFVQFYPSLVAAAKKHGTYKQTTQ